MTARPSVDPASFRDPSGFIFTQQSKLYRQVNQAGAADYDLLLSSGLYDQLSSAGLLVRHREVGVRSPLPEQHYKTIQPDLIPFISYPYEWSFSQLQAAAGLTLDIQRRALERGLSLKDASPYNIQFIGARPIFIDTLSFERYQDNQPWVAYRQFCQHFLAPLALMARKDLRLGLMSRDYVDGLPLDLAARLLPFGARFNLGLNIHLFWHARSQLRLAGSGQPAKRYQVSRPALLGLVNNLDATIKKLGLLKQKTVWQNYYADTNYRPAAEKNKEKIVAGWLKTIRPKVVHDFGANTGRFSRLASNLGAYTISSDVDSMAVELNYQQAVAAGEKNLLPLVIDLTNPSPAIGWANQERSAFLDRAQADVVLALALVHHLAIANNLPLALIAATFRQVSPQLIIEFVPKTDSNTKRLLASRDDIFPDYSSSGFEAAFQKYFKLKKKQPIAGSRRILYWFTS